MATALYRRYRPERFGGPGRDKVKRPEGFFTAANLEFRPPEQVAQMVLRAVRENRAMVLTDASMRKTFTETYVDVVMDAFDQVEAFDRES